MGYDYTAINIHGLQVKRNSYNSLLITEGVCKPTNTQSKVQIHNAADVVINIFDYISVNQGTFYYVYIIKDKDNLADIDFVISTEYNDTDDTNDKLKGKYYRLIGVFRTSDFSTDILPYMLIGEGVYRKFIYMNDRKERNVLANGQDTSYTPVFCWNYVPEYADTINAEISNKRSRGYVYVTDNSWNDYDLIMLYGRDTLVFSFFNYYSALRYHIDSSNYGQAYIYINGFDYSL